MKVKILTFNGHFVDESLIQKGVYHNSLPIIHDEGETIESMKNRMDNYGKYISGFSAINAKNNLDKCKMEAFTLIRE